MAAIHTFTCPACGYAAEVAGDVAVTMMAVIATITCATCRALRDVVICDELRMPPDVPVPEHPTCPSSRTRTRRTSPWKHPGPCPSCGTTVEDGGVTRLED